MRVVFLDFDGVLNSHEYVRERRRSDETGVVGLDEVAVQRLNRLLNATGAIVVVSSTWRIHHSVDALQRVLRDVGFTGIVIDKTPVGDTLRGDEIQAWLTEAAERGVAVDSFVILDDDSDMAHLAHRHIKTSFGVGLTEADVSRAIKMLVDPAPQIVVASVDDTSRLA